MFGAYHPFLPLPRVVRIDPRLTVGIAAMVAVISGPLVATSVALCLAALVAAMERRQALMLVSYGAAIACSASALLLAPLVLALVLHRRFVWQSWTMAVLAAGCVLLSLLRIGAGLVATPLPSLGTGAPTLWAIALLLPTHAPLIGLALASVIGAAAMLTAHFSVQPLEGDKLLTAAGMTSLVIALLLPGQTAGWFLLPMAITSALALCHHDQRTTLAAMLVTGGWAIAVAGMAAAGATAIVAAIILLAAPRLRFAANDNQLWPNLTKFGTNWVRRSLR